MAPMASYCVSSVLAPCNRYTTAVERSRPGGAMIDTRTGSTTPVARTVSRVMPVGAHTCIDATGKPDSGSLAEETVGLLE